MLCFSPVGSTLRVRARKFPALVNCTNIDWFHEWPEEALVSVSNRFLNQAESELLTVRITPDAISSVHTSYMYILYYIHCVWHAIVYQYVLNHLSLG